MQDARDTGWSSVRRPLVCAGLGELGRSPYYAFYTDEDCCIVLVHRTSVRFEDLAEIGDCFAHAERTLAQVDRKRYALIVDVRGGPARNDPAFEEVLRAHRGRLLLGFARNVAIAKTAAGKLQIQRFANVDGRNVFVTHQPNAGFRYLGIRPHCLPEERHPREPAESAADANL